MQIHDQKALLEAAFKITKPLPTVPLGSWPTPVQPLAGLAEELGADLWVKRDDEGGELYGGNKVRKLEFLLGAARARGCQSVVTVGGVGSHQVIGTALYARELGMDTHAVVFPQPVTPRVRRSIELASALGVQLLPLPDENALPEVLERACQDAKPPYELIPAGGSSPAGNLGYLAAAAELARQIEHGEAPEPDDIFVAFGTGGTLAGLVLGCHLLGIGSRVIGVRAAPADVAHAAVVQRQITALAGLLRRLGAAVTPPKDLPVEIVEDQFGAGYGMPTPAAERAVALAREKDGLELETTYSGKAMAAVLAHCAGDGAGRGRRVMFWNTCNGRDTSSFLASGQRRPLPPELEEWLTRDALEGLPA